MTASCRGDAAERLGSGVACAALEESAERVGTRKEGPHALQGRRRGPRLVRSIETLCPPDIAAAFGKIMTDQRCSSFKTFLRCSRRAAEARYSALAARWPRVLAPDEAMAPRADHFLSGHCLS